MSQIKILQDLPQGELPQREERLRKTLFYDFMQSDLPLGQNTQREERLQRPILCLASSKILRGEDTLARGRGGWGVNIWKTQDTAMYYTYIESSLSKTKRKKENVLNQKSLGSASRRTSKERTKTKKNLFCAKKHKKVFLSLSSVCVIYPRGRSVRLKTKKRFSSSFFSLWKLSLRQILMNFDLGHFPIFSQSLFLCVIYPQGRSVRLNTQKGLSQSFFSLWKLSLRQILKNFHLGHFMFFSLSLFSLCGSTS